MARCSASGATLPARRPRHLATDTRAEPFMGGHVGGAADARGRPESILSHGGACERGNPRD
jgi:hypothetical protein